MLELADASCSWNSVNVLFQSLLNDPKHPNDNWHCLCFHFPHSGGFKLQVFILREFLDYLNGCITMMHNVLLLSYYYYLSAGHKKGHNIFVLCQISLKADCPRRSVALKNKISNW